MNILIILLGCHISILLNDRIVLEVMLILQQARWQTYFNLLVPRPEKVILKTCVEIKICLCCKNKFQIKLLNSILKMIKSMKILIKEQKAVDWTQLIKIFFILIWTKSNEMAKTILEFLYAVNLILFKVVFVTNWSFIWDIV